MIKTNSPQLHPAFRAIQIFPKVIERCDSVVMELNISRYAIRKMRKDLAGLSDQDS